MSLRSAVLAALLLAVLAAAYWPDLFTAKWFNLTVTKICAIDAPSKCYYVPKPPFDVGKYTVNVALYKYSSSTYAVYNAVSKYYMLRYIVYSNAPSWYIINITRPGILYSTSGSSYAVKSGGTTVTTTTYTVCGKTYNYAVYIQTPGLYNVTPFKPPYWLVDLSTCKEYRIADYGGGIDNSTTSWFQLYTAELLPVTRSISSPSYGVYMFNGTEHAYYVELDTNAYFVGAGFYIAGGTAVPTIVATNGGNWYGPRDFDAWNNSTLSGVGSWSFYNIGEAPGDGVIALQTMSSNILSPFEFTYITNNSTGYFLFTGYQTLWLTTIIYAKRFNVVEVTMRDSSSYLYNTRGIACPEFSPYRSVFWKLNSLSSLGEIEVCNNSTSTVVVVLYYSGSTYFYADIINQGKCAKLRWDTSLSSTPTLYVYKSVYDFCAGKSAIMSTTSYRSGWRHFLFSNNTLKAVASLSPDFDYASTWLQILNYTRQLYNNLTKAYSAWLNATIAASKTAANASLSNFIATLPKSSITIKMDESTSTWLKTTLNVLKTYQISGVSSSFGTVNTLTVPTAVAPAAASAVAVAWAASRRDDDVVTAAAIAGIALALFGILMTLVYGTGSLTLVALGIIVAAAAAAWKKI